MSGERKSLIAGNGQPGFTCKYKSIDNEVTFVPTQHGGGKQDSSDVYPENDKDASKYRYGAIKEDTNKQRVNTNLDWGVFFSVSLADFTQKVVFTAFLANLVLYASTYLNCQGLTSLLIFLVITFFYWLTCALACLIPESLMTNFSLVCVGFCFLTVGMSLLTLLTALIRQGSNGIRFSIIVPFLSTCIGAGIITVYLPEFSKSQTHFSTLSEFSPKTTQRVYWLTHVAAIFVIAFITYLEQETYFEAGYGLSISVLIFGLVIFALCVKKHESRSPSRTSALKIVLAVCREAKIVGRTYTFQSKTYDGLFVTDEGTVDSWLDFAQIKFGGTFDEQDVSEVKAFLKLACILPAFVPYWIVHAQGFSTFIYQGLHLDLNFLGYQVPAAFTSLFGMLLAFLILLLFNKVTQPCLSCADCSCKCSSVAKIIYGMILAAIAVFAAGGVEMQATSEYQRSDTFKQNIGFGTFPAVRLSVFLQIPQYLLLFASEVYVGMTVRTMVSMSCPIKFQRLLLSLHYFVIAIGNVITLVLLSTGWFPSSYFQNDYLQMYFLLLGGAMLVGTLLFVSILPEETKKDRKVRDESEDGDEEDANTIET